MTISAVSKKGLTTIPRRIRALLGIREGDKIEWRAIKDQGRTIIQVEPIKNPYEYLKGKKSDSRLTYEKVEHIADSLLLREIKKGAHR
ncbi:MAG: type II toxin-antitoxin system PrlF family antitoxin [Euryarchaeota archaeon]|nr:type II toxin-antitoxin system PrlF family antitoxin [Euryarchaeota archaeon]